MSNAREGEEAGEVRLDEAADWFARMRGPDAKSARPAFEAWITDPRNAAAFAEIEQIWEVSAASRVHRRVDAPLAAGWTWQGYALAAALALAVLAAAVMLTGYNKDSLLRGVRPSRAYISQIGQIRTIDLPDGSVVILDTASSIDVLYTGRERRIALRNGRARFAVAHDAARPFVVVARDQRVTARGTLFDVRLDPQSVEVALFAGAVDVESETAAQKPPAVIRLTPGHKLVSQRDKMNPPVQILPAGADEWVSGLLPAEDMTLADVVAEANRYSRTPISLSDVGTGQLRVSGAFRPGDAEALATRLAAALDLEAVKRSDGSILLSRRPY